MSAFGIGKARNYISKNLMLKYRLRIVKQPAPIQLRNTDSVKCSVAAIDGLVEMLPLYLRSRKCYIPPRHETAAYVETQVAPAKNTVALVDPRIVTAEEIEFTHVPQAFRRLVVAHRVCHWSTSDRSAIVQIANPSIRQVYYVGQSWDKPHR